MTDASIELGAPDTDQAVDLEISACLNPKQPRSFFLYAGAGSGKTRSLKNALDEFRVRYGEEFRRTGKKIAVITYTNAAADEIADRVGNDTLFPISTIHSFCWENIEPYRTDIQSWLLHNLPNDLSELQAIQAKGRAGSQAALDRERAITALEKRLKWLETPRRFTYNPNGDNYGADSLSHSEVLKITSDFILTKPLMQTVLINKFPFILIDESQDTNKALLESVFALAAAHQGNFGLGLFGDTMQRIYADGKRNLDRTIPETWAKPVKRMNHRCPQRIVKLGNSLRLAVDGQRQIAREDSAIGTVRLFIAPATAANKPELEHTVCSKMAELSTDLDWLTPAKVKTLTLEHHMAASRCGFLPLFEALNQDTRLATGLRTGELAGLRFFSEKVAPLLAASHSGDKFGVMAYLRENSPLLRASVLARSDDSKDPLRFAREAVEAVTALNIENSTTTFFNVLKCIAKHNLLELPAALQAFAEPEPSHHSVPTGPGTNQEEEEEAAEASPSSLKAWRAFLETPYNQITSFAEYVSDAGPFGTHQGVKGLEFERVLVVLDDSEAKGFLFSYEKLFGAKPLSDQDRKNEAEGSETGIDRTRRLLYVTCTRAEKSLALVAYTDDSDALIKAVLQKEWFAEDELELL